MVKLNVVWLLANQDFFDERSRTPCLVPWADIGRTVNMYFVALWTTPVGMRLKMFNLHVEFVFCEHIAYLTTEL